MIKISNLKKKYENLSGENFILSIDNLTFSDNKKYALIGANGSGKSTLLKCIAKVITYDGKIDIDGLVAYMPQEPVIFKTTTIKNLELVCKEKAAAALSQFSLLNLSKQRGDKLSGGEKQRLALARTVIANSNALLLDEPTSMIDVNFTQNIENIICSQSKCVIFATHEIGQAKKIADEIIYFEKGKIVEIIKKSDNFSVTTKKLQNFFEHI